MKRVNGQRRRTHGGLSGSRCAARQEHKALNEFPFEALTGLRVLMVDDEPDILELAEQLLRISGAAVTTASSASEALGHLTREDFDVLVSDIGLPIKDGLALLREIRARGLTAERLPAVALTGWTGPREASSALSAGFQVHLAKPIEAAALIKAIAAAAQSIESGGRQSLNGR